MKDEGTNLVKITNGLKSVVNCDDMGILKFFEGVYFGHAFSKAYQYTIVDEKLSFGLQPMSIKVVQSIS